MSVDGRLEFRVIAWGRVICILLPHFESRHAPYLLYHTFQLVAAVKESLTAVYQFVTTPSDSLMRSSTRALAALII